MKKILKAYFFFTCGILGITILSGIFCLLSDYVYANSADTVYSVNIRIKGSCTMSKTRAGQSFSGYVVMVNNSTTIVPGMAVSATCNDSNGYSLYAIGYSNSELGNTNLIAGSPLSSAYNIATGVIDGDISSWAMKVTAGEDGSIVQNDYSVYKEIPSSWTKIVSKASGLNLNNETTASVDYQIFASSMQPAGSYRGEVGYVLVYPSTQDCPDFYVREGGVCRKMYMQEFTDSDCGSLKIGKFGVLADKRDGSAYTITRLGDGLCWMVSDLHIGSTTEAITLTSADTDITSNFILPIIETSSTKTQWGTANSTEGLDVAHVYQYSSLKNLYNWYTATGGTSYTSHSSSTSICPKNWKMITSAQADAYLSVVGETRGSSNIDILIQPPLSFSPGYYDSTAQVAYSNKLYWVASGGWTNSSGAYLVPYFGIRYTSGANYVQTNYGYQKMMGLGVRCAHTSNKTAGFSIRLDANGGDVSVGVLSGTASQIISALPTPTRSGYTFSGWYTAKTNGSAISNVNIAQGTEIYYAIWEADSGN